MQNHHYDCLIHHMIHNKEYIKGPVVDMKLIHFYAENESDGLPFYWYEILIGNISIGKITLRLGYNETTLSNGHVGYEIDQEYQGHNYSYYALEMIKVLAMDHGFRYLLVSTTVDNTQSQRTIAKAGGKILLSDYEVPKDHMYYVLGKPNISLYEIALG